MSKPGGGRLLGDLLGVIYRRRSPERLTYSRPMLIAGLVLAICAALLAHLFFFAMELPLAVLKMVCELGLFVLGLNLAVRARARRERVLKMALALVLISGLGDLALLILAALPLPDSVGVARVGAGLVVASQIYGAVNCVQFGMTAPWLKAAAIVVGYVVATLLAYQIGAALISGLL